MLPHVETQAVYLGADWSNSSQLLNFARSLDRYDNFLVHSRYMDMLTGMGYGVVRGTSDGGAATWILNVPIVGEFSNQVDVFVWKRTTQKADVIGRFPSLGFPVWSPDGSRLVATDFSRGGSRSMVIVDTKRPKDSYALTHLPQSYNTPTCSHDGKHLMQSMERGEVRFMNPDTGDMGGTWLVFNKEQSDRDFHNLQIGPSGHFRCDELRIEAELRYVVQFADGVQATMTAK